MKKSVVSKVSKDFEIETKDNSIDNSLSFYYKKISKYPVLSTEEEKELARLSSLGDNNAKTKLIQSNLRLVINIARKSIHISKLSMADLIQEGNLGLMVALDKYNWKLGYKFSTYATWWIKQAMFKAISEQSHCMKIPVYIQETLSKYKKIKNSLEQKYNCQIKPSIVADKMGISENKINTFLNAFTKSLSIENSLDAADDKQLNLSEIIEDVKQNVEKEIESEELKKDIKKALNILKEKEREVITLRFGLEDSGKRTLEEIGNIYGVTKECIRQIEKRAIRKIYMDYETRSRLLNYIK
ncbi:TPA: RNA polymerase sigma factor RpoD/SigA [Candidatus Galligastranaerophilus gallistercoris]|nr:RNA polymerase sigma factor RpoD/SigA [Candidatus Galligastranaerophilus gallistercoris]